MKELMITAVRDGWTIVRDASKFKKISLPQAQSGSSSSSEEESHESISDDHTVTDPEQGPTASDPEQGPTASDPEQRPIPRRSDRAREPVDRYQSKW